MINSGFPPIVGIFPPITVFKLESLEVMSLLLEQNNELYLVKILSNVC